MCDGGACSRRVVGDRDGCLRCVGNEELGKVKVVHSVHFPNLYNTTLI